MHKKNTIQSKLNLFIFGIIVLIIIIGCSVAIYIFFTIYEDDVEKHVSAGVYAFEKIVIEDSKSQLLSLTRGVVTLSGEILLNNNLEAKQTLQKYIDYGNNGHLEFVQIKGLGQVNYEKTYCDQSVLEMAAKKIDIKSTEPILWIDGDSETGLHLFSACLINDAAGNPMGEVRMGLQVANQELVEYLHNTSALEATIFSQNTRMATTITKNAVNSIGTTLDPAIASIVLGQGKEYFGKTKILGETYVVAYIPVNNSDNQPVGVLFVGKSMASMVQIQNQIIVAVSMLAIFMILIFYAFSNRWLKINIIKPISWVADAMKTIAKGDYSIVEKLPVAKNEEIEILQTTMQSMVREMVTDKKKLETAAYIDSVTGLSNRVLLYEKYNEGQIARTEKRLSVLFYLDVDNLKYINNLFGHRFGDRLLIQIGEILKGLIKERPEYEVYRISGDEFAICKEDYFEPGEVTELSKLILGTFKKAFTIEEQSVSASVSIGISYNEYCGGVRCGVCTKKCMDNLDTLLKKAELAMNQVKMNGKNNFMLFDPSMNEIMENKASMEQDLKRAIKRGELEIYYQPKFNLEQNRYDGFEALARWNHPIRGFVPPLEFITIAEESNLILELGTWILEQSCGFVREYNRTHHSDYCVAVNVSALQLLNEGFETMVLDTLEATGLDPSYLELEITESVLMDSMDLAVEKLSLLRNKNIGIVLDDFGTGYSSLTYLQSLPITTVKLDKSFVDDIALNEISYEIVSNVIQIAKSIGLEIVVEGIETDEQLQVLKKLKCHKIQGFYFSKPVPGSELEAVLSQYE
ncbi:EAL domain-containing protein [Acetobacterium bakii]|uniref:Diguanylate cyclase n=1 Tax=Acetobacterium bakii TaxID=52689 RepID=A0A0L6TVX6_9FIRM|nr:EAL domain-containing protein [Acetobacterium bakii]KNZ40411.1 hypothetical protein AKG39_17785 [Acetobacterium bakii]